MAIMAIAVESKSFAAESHQYLYINFQHVQYLQKFFEKIVQNVAKFQPRKMMVRRKYKLELMKRKIVVLLERFLQHQYTK
jgi:hypothetical protein